MVLVSNVTAAFCVNALPSSTAPVFSFMAVAASMFPLKMVLVPRVAEEIHGLQLLWNPLLRSSWLLTFLESGLCRKAGGLGPPLRGQQPAASACVAGRAAGTARRPAPRSPEKRKASSD